MELAEMEICFLMHWENYISISFHSEWDMIVWWQFLNQIEFPFGSKTVTTIISHSIHCERKWKYSFLSVKENTEYLELFITVDNTKFQQGRESLLFFQ